LGPPSYAAALDVGSPPLSNLPPPGDPRWQNDYNQRVNGLGASVRAQGDWTGLSTAGDPILVVGRRPTAKTLEAFVIELQEDTFDVMRDIARMTIDELAVCDPVDWHPNASIEQGEQYLVVNVEDLPAPGASQDRHQPPNAIGSEDPRLGEAAALLRLALAPGDLDNLHPGALAESDFRFYAVVWEQGDAGRPVAFVSEYNPTMILRKAKSFFRFDGTLRLADPPDLALDDQADLVVTGDQIAILKPAVFDRLFSDIRALLNDVPAYIAALGEAYARLQLSDESRKALEVVCATRPTYARRLQNLAANPSAGRITPALLRIALKNHSADPSYFIRGGVVEVSESEVGELLDVLEGRWYEADFTKEPRRAATWSRRASRPPSTAGR
jgi:hypothetical protein